MTLVLSIFKWPHKTGFTVGHEYVQSSNFSVSQIYFELASISKNQSSNFRGFTIYKMSMDNREDSDQSWNPTILSQSFAMHSIGN